MSEQQWDGSTPTDGFRPGERINLIGLAAMVYRRIALHPGLVISQRHPMGIIYVAHRLQDMGLVEWVTPNGADRRHGWYAC